MKLTTILTVAVFEGKNTGKTFTFKSIIETVPYQFIEDDANYVMMFSLFRLLPRGVEMA